MGIEPRFGLRVRLSSSGSGKWAESGGDHSKFGVSTPDLITIVERLEAAGRPDALHLLHFHLGSQIADINNLKAGVREISRVYAYLRRRGLGVRYVDCGGGLGVNYDAGAAGAHGAVDYSVQEYANAIVFAVQEICTAEDVAPPTLITENGRALTAHHSVLLVEVFGATTKPEASPDWTPAAADHAILHELHRIRELVTSEKTLRLAEVLEAYHDAVEQRAQADTLFGYGYLDLEAKARAERLYWSVCRAINERVHRADPDWLPQELADLDDHLVDQYLCDFSVFQSMLDYWAIGQRFPVMPIHRLGEEPTRRATLVDLTCDSDGKVSRFVAPDHDKRFLEVHPFEEGDRYVLAFFLMGAYQDILGDTHNLLGSVTEAHVYADADEPDNFYVETILPGTRVEEILSRVQYERQGLEKRVERLLRAKSKAGAIRPREATTVLESYRRMLGAYTYYDTQAG
jgi:arginine decarboxylase